MTGARYPLSGQSMPHLIPYVEQMLGLPIDAAAAKPESAPVVPPPRLDPALTAALERLLPDERRSTDSIARLARSHGQLAVGEIDRLLYGGQFARVADLVVEPVNEDEVRAIVAAAVEHGACVVPFGGGTNVSGALLCPEDERRTIVSIDMRRMNRLLNVDRANCCALVEAGITGADLEAALGALGYTCGHTPDSMEFSTLGGWIATNASGMKKNRYGNIEDIVVEATLVTPAGSRRDPPARPRARRPACSRSRCCSAAEGNLGVITKALIAIHPRPAECALRHRSSSPTSPTASRSSRRCAPGALPASIRVVQHPRVPLRPGAEAGVARRSHALDRARSGAGCSACRGFDPDDDGGRDHRLRGVAGRGRLGRSARSTLPRRSRAA